MPNLKAVLLWYCRTPRGWRRFPVLLGRNNRIRHTFVTDHGKEISYPEGRYQILVYEGSRPVYKNAGDNAADALAARDRETHLLAAKLSADNAGAKIVEEEKRTYLRRAAGLYVQDAENRNAKEAAEQAELVTSEFLDVCRKTSTTTSEGLHRRAAGRRLRRVPSSLWGGAHSGLHDLQYSVRFVQSPRIHERSPFGGR